MCCDVHEATRRLWQSSVRDGLVEASVARPTPLGNLLRCWHGPDLEGDVFQAHARLTEHPPANDLENPASTAKVVVQYCDAPLRYSSKSLRAMSKASAAHMANNMSCR